MCLPPRILKVATQQVENTCDRRMCMHEDGQIIFCESKKSAFVQLKLKQRQWFNKPSNGYGARHMKWKSLKHVHFRCCFQFKNSHEMQNDFSLFLFVGFMSSFFLSLPLSLSFWLAVSGSLLILSDGIVVSSMLVHFQFSEHINPSNCNFCKMLRWIPSGES